jgi:hypothetical protein
MDGLLAEVASKRKALESDAQRPTKYMRKGEIERLREEEEQKRKIEQEAKEAATRQEKEAEAIKKAKVCFVDVLLDMKSGPNSQLESRLLLGRLNHPHLRPIPILL